MVIMRICSKCKKERNESDFYKRSDRKVHTLVSNCKFCYSERRKKQYSENREKENRQNSIWYSSVDKEKLAAIRVKYRETLPGIYQQIKSSANSRKVPFELTLEYFVKWYTEFQGICHYCKRTKEECLKTDVFGFTRMSIDRVDNTKGYLEGNLVIACSICNYTKCNCFTENEMLLLGKTISSIFLERKIKNVS
jgi:hypothetical protein